MFRTLAESLAALATRSCPARRGLERARLGIERLETRSLLSATGGGWYEQTTWHFEDGHVDRYYRTESRVAFREQQYQSASYSWDAPMQSESAVSAQGRGSVGQPPMYSQVGSSMNARPATLPSGPHYLIIIVTPGEKQSLGTPASGNWEYASGEVQSGVEGPPNVVGPTYPRSLRSMAPKEEGSQPPPSDPNYRVAPLEALPSDLAGTISIDNGTAADASRLLSTLQSHDAVFQALAAQSSASRLRTANEWLLGSTSSTSSENAELLAPHELVARGHVATDGESDSETFNENAAASASRGGAILDELVSAVQASHRAERRATVVERSERLTASEVAATKDLAAAVAGGEAVVASWDGGMVLLRTPEGGGDLAALDAAMALEGGATIGMDAGVGMYRAFDVGTAGSEHGTATSTSKGESTVRTEPAREAVAAPGSARGLQLTAAVAGAAVLGAWGARSRAKAEERKRRRT